MEASQAPRAGLPTLEPKEADVTEAGLQALGCSSRVNRGPAVRHPLPLVTREVAPVPLTRRTALVLQDLHAPFSDPATGALALEAGRRYVAREFDDYWRAVPAAIANAGRVLEAARGLGLAVHHVCWAVPPGGEPSALQQAMGWTWQLDGPQGTFPEAVRPRIGESVHAKSGWGALGTSALAGALRSAGIESVLMVGLPLDFGVRHTLLELADAGYCSLLADDATAALTVTAEAPSRGNLSHGATKLRSTAEVLGLLGRIPAEGCVWV
jgi:nicotinamidase-related amidase